MAAVSQMDTWKAAVLHHELNYDLTKHPHNKKIVFSMVKNKFALSSGFQHRYYIPNALGSSTVHDIHISVDFCSLLYIYT